MGMLAIDKQLTPALESLATLNKAAADPLRLQVLQLLEHNSFGVLELADIFSISQSRLSHHLKILLSAGFVTTRREGNSIFYRRALLENQDDGLDLVRSGIFKVVDSQPLPLHYQHAVKAIYEERAAQSQAFFERHAGKFTEVQDLIAGYEHYADSVAEIMHSLALSPSLTAMEVGPGQGGFLKPLADQFNHVIALDNSPAMLDLAAAQMDKHQYQHINYRLGDPQQAVSQNIKTDFLAFNMVLHHIPSPSETLKASAQLLNPQGYLLITDLCPHDQGWVKESCGDLWLGLEADDIKQWAQDAGLEHKQQVIIGMRNGFQIQIQLFQQPLNKV